jgi:hypothetical protein
MEVCSVSKAQRTETLASGLTHSDNAPSRADEEDKVYTQSFVLTGDQLPSPVPAGDEKFDFSFKQCAGFSGLIRNRSNNYPTT